MPQAFLTLALLLAALAPHLASAAAPKPDPRGFYVGGALGSSRAEDWCGPYFDTTIQTCDNNTIGFKLFAGYRFNEFLAFEGGYLDLGSLSLDALYQGVPLSNQVDIRGGTAQAVLHLPITPVFSVFGKAGGIYWDVKNDTTLAGYATGQSNNGVDVALGIGAEYFLTRHFALRVEYEYFLNLGTLDTIGGDVDLRFITIGGVWRF